MKNMEKNKGRAFLDIHVIQYLPPNNINRDDLGRPKTIGMGGTTRARVSSQSWKRAMRLGIQDSADFLRADRGVRSRQHLVEIAKVLVEISGGKLDAKQATKLVTDEAVLACLKADKSNSTDSDASAKEETTAKKEKKEKTEDAQTQTLNLSQSEVKSFTEAIYAMCVEGNAGKEARKKAYAEIFKKGASYDIALFGRMMAAGKDLSVDACASVAHAISTHEAKIEFDFFTAVDEIDAGGSAHMGVQELTSGVMYRYTTLSLHELFDVYSTDPVELTALVSAYITNFAYSLPTGKSKSTNPSTMPAAIILRVRDDRPQSYADAFVKSVKGEDLVVATINTLEDHIRLSSMDHRDPVESYVSHRVSKELGTTFSLKDDAEVSELVKGIVDRAVGRF